MNDENMVKAIDEEVEKELATSRLKLLGTPKTAAATVTVTRDIEALKSKLDTIARGILLLKDQL